MMGDRANGWITVGHRNPPPSSFGIESDVEQELRERETIAAWDNDEQWPSVHKPPLGGQEAKRFDARLVILDYLGGGAFGRVDKVMHGSICLARKRITRRRGITIDDLRQEGLTMRKLDHRHVVKLVAAYMPRPHELCLLIWPAAVCDLDTLLVDLDQLRLGTGDRDEILARLKALELNDLSAIEPSLEPQSAESAAKCPFEFLRGVIGCIARGLAHCHSNDVRHLDIKPSNILLKAGRVYLADFGISKDVSGQDQTTIDGNPGTEKWRAPELYGEDGSSMQLSDIYSLGLVLLNVATVLYKVRLSEFDDALLYPQDLPRHEKLAIREDKLKKLLDTLAAHALVTPPFMFTYEGLETVRPRPLVSLIARLTSPVPRNRLPADKLDEKLSMLGGIHQIYHGGCCKRPIAWVEDKWDKKFSALASLKGENEVLRRKVAEYQGRDETYEQRLENARKAHEHDVSKLQAMLKEAEERCRVLEQSQGQGQGQGGWKNKGQGRGEQHERQSNQGLARDGSVASRTATTTTTASAAAAIGLGLSKIQTHPSSIPKRPSIGPSSLSSPRVSSFEMHYRSPPSSVQTVKKFAQGAFPIATTMTTTTTTTTTPTSAATGSAVPPSPGIMSRSQSGNSTTGYHLRSRGSGSKLPLPVTPISRSQTPNLNREQSLTDSSMTSSVFSQQSVDTLPTPCIDSPAPGRRTTTTTRMTKATTRMTTTTTTTTEEDGDEEEEDEEEEEEEDGVPRSWGRLPAESRRRPLSPSRSSSPDLPMSPSMLPSLRPQQRSRRSEAVDGSDVNATARPKIPALLPSKSWAEIAKEHRPTAVR